MRLITSYLAEPVRLITESKNGEKKLFIEGIFMQAEKENRNRRRYGKKILEKAVKKYDVEFVKTGRSVGELGHPETHEINYDRVSHRITELRWDGNDVIGKALILNTPCGNIVRGLVEGGCLVGVSSRGLGSVEEDVDGVSVVQEDFLINTVDIVQDPSAPEAFVNGIMEGVEYFLEKNTGRIIAEKIDVLKKKFHKMTKTQLAEQQAAEFAKFLQSIR